MVVLVEVGQKRDVAQVRALQFDCLPHFDLIFHPFKDTFGALKICEKYQAVSVLLLVLKCKNQLVNFDRFIGYFNDILNDFGFVGVVIILVSDAEVERIIE